VARAFAHNTAVMKPAPFEYHEPTTLPEALELLGELGDEAKPLAGGQSLVPMMNFRLARPQHLVDLNRLGELAYVRQDGGTLCIGAMTRQRQVERASLVAEGWPLIPEAVALIGHTQIRNRGTIGGSLAHADPAAELPAVMAALDAELVIRSRRGQRSAQPEAFFESYYTTSLAPDELLMEVRIPSLPPRTGWSFQEVSRRHGDFALVGVAATLTLDDAGAITRARLVFIGAAPTPVRSSAAEAMLVGQRPLESLFREAGARGSEDLDPVADVHATAEYRREVGAVMARRALMQAAERARGEAPR
jgi:CO/xanthine dehydrogenase FAD-binding subunit